MTAKSSSSTTNHGVSHSGTVPSQALLARHRELEVEEASGAVGVRGFTNEDVQISFVGNSPQSFERQNINGNKESYAKRRKQRRVWWWR
jgi:hypothetical protein